LVTFLLGAGVVPAAAQGNTATINGTMMSGTFTVSAGIYRFGFNQLPNEASLSCGPGSTTAPNGGPQGNSLECVFPNQVTTGTWTMVGTTPWPNSVTITPFVSPDNATYVTGTPITVTASAPTPTAVTTPPAATTPTAAPKPAPGPATNQPNANVGGGSPLFWLPLGIGIALVVAASLIREKAEDDEEELEEPDKEEELSTNCAAERAAVAAAQTAAIGTAMVASAAQAAVAAAQQEFDAASAALDELQRMAKDNMPAGTPYGTEDEAVWKMLFREIEVAATRVRKARLELELAQDRLSEAQGQAGAAKWRLVQAQSRLATCLGEGGPVTDGSPGVYPDYSSEDGGLPLPPQRPSSIPGMAYGGGVVEVPPSGDDGESEDDPEGTGTETDWERPSENDDPAPPRTPIG
jgi:hypothetical protein